MPTLDADLIAKKLSPEQISHDAIRSALERFSGARLELNDRKRDTVELENTRAQAEWADAEAEDAAKAAGKPAPRRTHVAAHDKKLDQAKHVEKVAAVAVERLRVELDETLQRDGEAWLAELTDLTEALREEWQARLNAVITLHGRLSAALSVLRAIEEPAPAVAAISLKPGQVNGREWASGQKPSQLAYVEASDVLAALFDLGQPVDPEQANPSVPGALPVGPNRWAFESPNANAARHERELGARAA